MYLVDEVCGLYELRSDGPRTYLVDEVCRLYELGSEGVIAPGHTLWMKYVDSMNSGLRG